MSTTPQNTIAIVYDYDQTLSPSYMQDEVVFPAFRHRSAKVLGALLASWCGTIGYDNELAYMKVLLDTSAWIGRRMRS